VAAAIVLALVPAAIEREHPPAPPPAISRAQDRAQPATAAATAAAQPRPHIPAARHPAAPQRFPDGAVTATRAIQENASYSPSFSNVGTAMFFHEEAGGRSALMRADTGSDGSVLKITRIVDDNAQNFHARPSPDGALIAFDSDRDGTRGVYIATARGTDVRRISGEGFAAVPTWSPDGRQLAFVKAEADNPRVWNLWTCDIATGEQRRLTSYAVGQPWGGSWFPDGRRIAYSHETDLVVLDLATGGRRVYPTPLKGRLVRTPAVSPDGRRIIFQVYRDGAWLLDVERGTMRRVLDDPSAEEYTWSPDGHRVAFHSHRAGGWGVWILGQ
jgi:dipeptidyl aminopeptidase/acylaminoacyl peptidase